MCMLVPSQQPTSQRWLRDKGHHFDFGVHFADISAFWLCVLTGKPPSVNAWLAQCCLYVLLMVVVKICITVLIQFDFWDDVRDFILSPVTNPKVEVVVVMLIIPFFINVSILTHIMITSYLRMLVIYTVEFHLSRLWLSRSARLFG